MKTAKLLGGFTAQMEGLEMKKLIGRVAAAMLLMIVSVGLAHAQAPSAEQIMEKSHQAYYYAGDGGHARVKMVLTDKKGRTREREFWMVRADIQDMGDQRYFTYFLDPADVRRTSFLVHKQAEGNDDRWLYIPALDLVKRIAADDRGSSFIGSDFSYEDVSGRLPNMDHHEIMGEDTVMGRTVTKIKSTPKDGGTADYAYRISWIDKETYLPLKEEYFEEDGELRRVFEIGKIEAIDGYPTGVERIMTNVQKGTKTELSFTDISYQPQLEADDFTERLLKSPPRDYTR